MQMQPFSPQSPTTAQTSHDADNLFLHSASPSTATSSHDHYHGQFGHAQGQALPLSSYVVVFLQEYGLQERLGESVMFIYNMPVPAWFKFVNSLDLTYTQRGELIAVLTNDWLAEGDA